MLFACLRALAWIVAWLPFRALAWPGSFLGWLAGSAFGIRRRHVEGGMETAGIPSAGVQAREMYRRLGQGVFELLWMAGHGRRSLRSVARVEECSMRLLARALCGRKGIVLAASHTGNWELAAARLAEELPDLAVVINPPEVPGFERFTRRLRDAYRVHGLEPRGAIAKAREILARGGVVAVLIDQVPAHRAHGLPLQFLGRSALVSRGAASLSAATGAPLVVTASRRCSEGTHELEVLSIMEPPSRGRSAWAEEATARATQLLEGFVRRHPADWLWLHRRWRQPLRQALEGTACFPPRPPLNEARDA